MTTAPATLDRERIAQILGREEADYRARTPHSASLFARAKQSLPLGRPVSAGKMAAPLAIAIS